MKKFLLLSAVFISVFSSTFAADKIYTIGSTAAIVADDTDWDCQVLTKTANPMVHYKPCVEGLSNHFPLKFIFSRDNNNRNSDNLEVFLRKYAERTETILLDVTIKENPTGVVIGEGRFFDNSTSGHFQVYCLTIDVSRLMMFIKIDSELIDENTISTLYKSANDLITPLYTPKALTLWLESVEKERKAAELE